MVNMKKISMIALTILTLGVTSCDMDKMPYDAVPTEEALTQINSKKYAIPYQADHRKIVKVGVNFDSATRTIGEWKIELGS